MTRPSECLSNLHGLPLCLCFLPTRCTVLRRRTPCFTIVVDSTMADKEWESWRTHTISRSDSGRRPWVTARASKHGAGRLVRLRHCVPGDSKAVLPTKTHGVYRGWQGTLSANVEDRPNRPLPGHERGGEAQSARRNHRVLGYIRAFIGSKRGPHRGFAPRHEL